MDFLFDFIALFGIPVIIALIVYLWFDRMVKKAIIAGLVALLIFLLMGWDAREIMNWF